MKLITRDTDYAVRALSFIAQRKGEIISVESLAANLKIPRPFLRKILQLLNKRRVLKSYKGQGGGFRLRISPDKIFLSDIMEVFQGGLKLNSCLFKRKICPNRSVCALRRKINRIEEGMISELKTITIGSLLK